jgi:hypothetical protein
MSRRNRATSASSVYLNFCFVAICVSVLENVLVFQLSTSASHAHLAPMLDTWMFYASAAGTTLFTCWFVLAGVCSRRMADRNRDGVLDDAEVIDFQERSFDPPASSSEAAAAHRGLTHPTATGSKAGAAAAARTDAALELV